MMPKKLKTLMKESWSSSKGGLIPEKFVAEVEFDGSKAIALQEMANRHRAEGYKVTEEFFTKDRGMSFAVSECQFMRVTIERGQLELGRDA